MVFGIGSVQMGLDKRGTVMQGIKSLLVIGLICVTAGVVADTGVDRQRLATLEDALQGYVQNDQLAGGVLFVSRHGETVLHKAFGWQDKEQGVPMQTNSLHRIASQTKAFTSVAIMLLQEQGALLLSDPLSKYFPEWAQTTVAVADDEEPLGYRIEPAQRPITVRDLLTHTAGINYGWGTALTAWQEAGIVGWYFAGDQESMRDKVRRMAALPQAAQPGSAFVYGYNTDILGALVEHLSGQSLGEFLQQHIFAPLQMRDTYFFVPVSEQSRLSVVYASGDQGLQRQPDASAASSENYYFGQGHYLQGQVSGPRSYSGGAGAVSTAADYGRFLEMLRRGGQLDGVRILGRKSVELMSVNHLPTNIDYSRPGSGFGLGFNVVTDLGQSGQIGSVGSYGWGGAYHSTYWIDPEEGLVVSYVTQLIPAKEIDDHGKIRALIYQALVD